MKKIPLRMCLGCRERKPKKDLIRVVKNKQDEVFLDVTGKANGRGAYICNEEKCLEKAYKAKSLNRALSTNISEKIYEELKGKIDEHG